MSAARPRRSTAANTSFKIQFPDLPGSSDEEQDSGEEQPEGEDGQQDGDGERAAKVEDDDEIEIDSSGSEYAPVVIKDKDGTLIEEIPSDEEDDSTDLEDAEDDEDDDGDSAAGEKELDDISIATSAGMSEDSEAGAGQGLKHGRNRAGVKDGPSMRVVGRTPLALMANVNLGKKAGPRRSGALTSQRGAAAKTPWYDLTYTPSFSPPRYALSHPWGDAVHCPQNTETGGIEARGAPTEDTIQKMVKRNAYLPFGPHWTICEDHAYHKGKYMRSTDSNGIESIEKAPTWGGWYEDVRIDLGKYKAVSDIG